MIVPVISMRKTRGKNRSRWGMIKGSVLGMMLEMLIRCANKEKCPAECWINESEIWENIGAGNLKTAGICVAFKAMGLDEISWTEGEDKQVQ